MKTPGEVVGRARSWSEDDWWRLEIAAFREHRGVLMGLARKMPMDLWRDVQKTQPGTTFADFLGGVCHLVSLVVAWALAPLLAIRCLVLAVRGFDAPLVTWQLGAVALVAAVSVFYPLFRWRGGATDRWTRVLVIGVLVSTVIYLVTGLVAWERGGLDGSPLWLWARGGGRPEHGKPLDGHTRWHSRESSPPGGTCSAPVARGAGTHPQRVDGRHRAPGRSRHNSR